MSVLAVVTGLVAALGFLAAGVAKLTKHEQMVVAADRLEFPMSQFQIIGALETAGAVGVVIGLLSDDMDALGIAAAAGLVLVGLGATVTHRRAGDEPKDSAGGAVLASLAIVHILATIAA